MKKLKLFFALFAMLALGVGNAWGAEVFKETFAKSTGTSGFSGSAANGTFVADNKGWTHQNPYGAGGAAKFGASKKIGEAETPSISCGNGVTSATLTFKAGAWSGDAKTLKLSYTNCSGAASVTLKDAAWSDYTVELTNITGDIKIKFTGNATSKARFFLDDVIVTVIESSGGDEPETPVASLSATPTTIDFGNVYEGATVTDKTVAVNFANLTGAVTYSGLSTPFSATGAISATGDEITISADASTIGKYSQTLTIASTADSKTAEVTVKMNVVEKPAPTGTFTLHTGDLIEGDYVIVDGTNAMNNTVTSNRLQYNAVTISNNEIVDPLAATIWHIAPNGEYWTIYSAPAEKYAASTTEKNQATLAASISDNTKWTVTMSGNTYDFENLARSKGSDSGNKYLRKNGSYGFACYASGTGAKLSLYRKAGAKYSVNISATTNGTVTASPTSAEAGTTIALTVTPDAGYVLDALTVTDASSNTIEVADNKFTMPASDVTVTATFKLNEKPAATLTLSKNGVTEDITGNKQDDVVTLPSITSDCVKEFVGWSANPTCNVAPEYKEGDKYTLAATTQTLYAVYATVQGGGEVTSEDLFENNGTYNSTAGTITWELANVVSILQEKSNASSPVADYVKDPRWYKDHLITITPSANIKEIVVKAQSKDYATALASSTYINATASASSDIVTITPTNGNEKITIKMGAQARLYTLTVTYAATASYSNYSTTCAAALANPTFSLAAGKYTEAKSVTISATEGTIYYTTDGTTPTASSTQYTGAIALNDCGEYTIKAIAISSDSQSDVVSATYTIKLPLTNSQAAPYTEAEAIAVYDGGCYDNQDVYVKGTVKTATFNSTYGNYTITLTNGFQFYRFLQAAETKFTEDIIVPGDVLVACGKLSKYETTYQLAEGCYLVERIPYEGEKTDISNTEATAYTVDKAFELIADVSSDLTKEVYVKGLVAVAPTSNPTAEGQMTYSISDNGENTGNVLKVYLGLNLNGEKFTSKNDVQQGDYVVVKGKLLDYNSTYELNKGNQLVQHKKAATITIADITMEVGETKTIAATITPAAAKTEVTYSIKENAANAISLSGNVITANAVGTATITATIATAADYMGKTIDFTVIVNAKSTKEKVVILAQYDGKWYAMTNECTDSKQMGAIEVNYKNGVLFDVDESTKASITWELAIADGKATFKNNDKYLIGGNSTTLNYANSKFEWVVDGDKYLSDNKSRTFLYNKSGIFKNYATSNAEPTQTDYSGYPVVAAPNYGMTTADVVANSYFSVADGKFVQFSTGNLQYEVGTNTWSFASKQYEVIGGEAYDPANPTNTNYGMNEPGYTGKLDLFGWSSDGKFGVNPSNTDANYEDAFADWGSLVNEEGWYTLTKDEMNYILNRKKDGKKLWALATVCGMNGLILLPDNWNTSTTLEYGYVPADWNYVMNQLDATAWATFEAAGAVFLPEGGTRVGGHGNKDNATGPSLDTPGATDAHGDYFHVDNVGEMGYYWLNTQDTRTGFENCASYLILPGWSEGATDANEDDICLQPQVWSREKRRGNSVRLVKEVAPDSYYTRTVTSGDYGTICLPNGGLLLGASAFSVLKMEGTTILLYEVGTTMVAGTPYVVFPNTGAKNLYVFYTDNANAPAGNANGLYGSYTREPLAPNAGYYIMLPGNRYAEVTGDRVFVAANRAYFKVDDIEDISTTAPALAPGVRRIAIGQAPQVATGMENIDASAQPVKTIINGQLFILRGEKMYDAQGKLVK